MRIYLLFPSLIMALGLAHAQTPGRIEGRVTLTSGSPLEAVSIGLVGTSYGASSASDGSFALEEITPGEYTIAATSLGYRQIRRQVYVNPGETLHISLTLTESST